MRPPTKSSASMIKSGKSQTKDASKDQNRPPNSNRSRTQPSNSQLEHESSESDEETYGDPKASKKAPVPKPKTTGAAKRKQNQPVLREIVRLQSTTDHQIPRAPFARLVHETMQKVSRVQFRLSTDALEAMRESCETYITQSLSDAYLITLNRGQLTLQPRDVQLMLFLRGSSQGCSR